MSLIPSPFHPDASNIASDASTLLSDASTLLSDASILLPDASILLSDASSHPPWGQSTFAALACYCIVAQRPTASGCAVEYSTRYAWARRVFTTPT